MSSAASPALPNRTRLRAGFFGALFAGWGVLMVAGGGCICDAEYYFTGGGVDDPGVVHDKSRVSVSYLSRADDGTGSLIEEDESTFIASVLFGFPMWVPEASMSTSMFLSDTEARNDRVPFPDGIDLEWLNQHGAEEHSYKTELRQAGSFGFYEQTEPGVMPEMHFDVGDLCALYMTSIAAPLLNSFIIELFASMELARLRSLPTAVRHMGPMGAWRLWRATSRMRAEGRSPMVLPLAGSIPAGKSHLMTMTFGLPLEMDQGELTVDGSFMGASRSRHASLPKKLIFLGKLLDENGDKVDTFRVVLRVRGGSFRSARKFKLGPWDIQPGYSLEVDLNLKGGSIEPGDGPVLNHRFVNDNSVRGLSATSHSDRAARQLAVR